MMRRLKALLARWVCEPPVEDGPIVPAHEVISNRKFLTEDGEAT